MAAITVAEVSEPPDVILETLKKNFNQVDVCNL